jgi:hypothetical protein
MHTGAFDDFAIGIDQGIEVVDERLDFPRIIALEVTEPTFADCAQVVADATERAKSPADEKRRPKREQYGQAAEPG